MTQETRRLSRRSLLGGAALAAGGIGLGVAGAVGVPRALGWNNPPVSGGYAAAADSESAISEPSVTVRYFMRPGASVVALTFDDGPGPHWTPRVLDALDEVGVAATFFMVGQRVEQHSELVRDRLDRHEVGNHSWSHRDLATLDLPTIRADLRRTHDVIYAKLGRRPRLLRPPFGHLGGSTLLAADSLGYDNVILWNREMHENRFAGNPAAQAKELIDTVVAGDIILAHDFGDDRRLNSIKAIPAFASALIAKGYRFVTVSDLIEAAGPKKA